MDTYNERISAWEYGITLRNTAESAARILDNLIEQFLEKGKPITIGSLPTHVLFDGDIAILRDTISMVSNSLWNAATEFSAETLADKNEAGVESYLLAATRATVHSEVNALYGEISDACRDLRGDKRDAINKKQHEACDLPDDQAIPALKAILEECKASA